MPIILFLAGLQSIPNDILEAASIDGATSKQLLENWITIFATNDFMVLFCLSPALTAFDQIFMCWWVVSKYYNVLDFSLQLCFQE